MLIYGDTLFLFPVYKEDNNTNTILTGMLFPNIKLSTESSAGPHFTTKSPFRSKSYKYILLYVGRYYWWDTVRFLQIRWQQHLHKMLTWLDDRNRNRIEKKSSRGFDIGHINFFVKCSQNPFTWRVHEIPRWVRDLQVKLSGRLHAE